MSNLEADHEDLVHVKLSREFEPQPNSGVAPLNVSPGLANGTSGTVLEPVAVSKPLPEKIGTGEGNPMLTNNGTNDVYKNNSKILAEDIILNLNNSNLPQNLSTPTRIESGIIKNGSNYSGNNPGLSSTNGQAC